MSRTAQRNGVSAPNDEGLVDPTQDECPICHSKRYLRRDMRFLINPECYHKMCESCVDRIFSHGPAPCPVAGCHKTLRRNRFREPMFEDLKLEREIDIRRYMAKIFNRREDEFDSPRDWNDYLNEVEDLTFNLINNIDVEETRAKLEAYERAHKEIILENRELEREGAREREARQVADQERVRQRRKEALLELEEERRERAEARNDVIQKLASGDGDALKIARDGRNALKKFKARKDGPGRKHDDIFIGDSSAGSSFLIKSLRKKAKAEPEKAYDPFGGLTDEKSYSSAPSELNLWDQYLGKARKEATYTAGGYTVREFFARSLSDAFSGLGVFISEEMSEKEHDRVPENTAGQQDAVMAGNP